MPGRRTGPLGHTQPSSRRAAPLAQGPQARLEEGFLFPPRLLEATPSSFPGTFASCVSEQTQRSSGHGHHSLRQARRPMGRLPGPGQQPHVCPLLTPQHQAPAARPCGPRATRSSSRTPSHVLAPRRDVGTLRKRAAISRCPKGPPSWAPARADGRPSDAPSQCLRGPLSPGTFPGRHPTLSPGCGLIPNWPLLQNGPSLLPVAEKRLKSLRGLLANRSTSQVNCQDGGGRFTVAAPRNACLLRGTARGLPAACQRQG